MTLKSAPIPLLYHSGQDRIFFLSLRCHYRPQFPVLRFGCAKLGESHGVAAVEDIGGQVEPGMPARSGGGRGVVRVAHELQRRAGALSAQADRGGRCGCAAHSQAIRGGPRCRRARADARSRQAEDRQCAGAGAFGRYSRRPARSMGHDVAEFSEQPHTLRRPACRAPVGSQSVAASARKLPGTEEDTRRAARQQSPRDRQRDC